VSSAGVLFARPRWDRGLHRRAAPGSSSLGPGGIAMDRRLGAARSEDPDAAHRSARLEDPTLPTGPLG